MPTLEIRHERYCHLLGWMDVPADLAYPGARIRFPVPVPWRSGWPDVIPEGPLSFPIVEVSVVWVWTVLKGSKLAVKADDAALPALRRSKMVTLIK